jgi:hypothetical protein
MPQKRAKGCKKKKKNKKLAGKPPAKSSRVCQ